MRARIQVEWGVIRSYLGAVNIVAPLVSGIHTYKGSLAISLSFVCAKGHMSLSLLKYNDVTVIWLS